MAQEVEDPLGMTLKPQAHYLEATEELSDGNNFATRFEQVPWDLMSAEGGSSQGPLEPGLSPP